MQALNAPPTRPQIAISPDLPAWTLDDLTKDHVLLEAELPRLDFWQATALKNLLISQSCVIRDTIAIESRGRGEIWTSRARLARSCKEASIGAVTAHIFDLDQLAKVSKRNRQLEETNGPTPYDQLIEKCDRLEAELVTLQASEAHVRKSQRMIYQVLTDTLGGETSGNIREESYRRMAE